MVVDCISLTSLLNREDSWSLCSSAMWSAKHKHKTCSSENNQQPLTSSVFMMKVNASRVKVRSQEKGQNVHQCFGIFKFIHFWLHLVLVAACGLSLMRHTGSRVCVVYFFNLTHSWIDPGRGSHSGVCIRITRRPVRTQTAGHHPRVSDSVSLGCGTPSDAGATGQGPHLQDLARAFRLAAEPLWPQGRLV